MKLLLTVDPEAELMISGTTTFTLIYTVCKYILPYRFSLTEQSESAVSKISDCSVIQSLRRMRISVK